MGKIVKTFKDLPFEEGQTYTTKMQTGEKFTITKILYKETKTKDGVNRTPRLFMGIYASCPHIGECPINVDRLIPVKVLDGEVHVCKNCGEPL